MSLRKNLIILIFVLGGVLVSLLTLNFQKLGENQKAQVLDTNDDFKNLPIKLSKGSINSFSLQNNSGKIVFYEKLDSMVYEISADGKNKKEIVKIPNASEILFSPSNKELIATLEDNEGLIKIYFNLETNQKIRLDKRIKNAAFSPDGKKLAYHFYDRIGDGNISVSKPNGSDFINIFKTRNENLKLIWPENDLIVFYPEENQSLVFSIKPDGKDFQKLPEAEYSIYFDKPKQEILKNMGIEATNIKLSPLGDYLIFINAKDGKLYSLRI